MIIVTNYNVYCLGGGSAMGQKVFGIMVLCIIVAQCGQLKVSEITLDDKLKVTLVNNVISDRLITSKEYPLLRCTPLLDR